MDCVDILQDPFYYNLTSSSSISSSVLFFHECFYKCAVRRIAVWKLNFYLLLLSAFLAVLTCVRLAIARPFIAVSINANRRWRIAINAPWRAMIIALPILTCPGLGLAILMPSVSNPRPDIRVACPSPSSPSSYWIENGIQGKEEHPDWGNS